MLLGDANDSKRIAPHLWRFALNSREGLDVRGRAVGALGDAALAFGCAKCAPDELDFATSLAKLLNEGTAAPLRAVAAEGAAKLLLAGRPLSADDAEAQPQSKAERRAVEILAETARRPWQIPKMAEKGFEIPIMITKSFDWPDIGKFKRWGMDVVVNAVWLAFLLGETRTLQGGCNSARWG